MDLVHAREESQPPSVWVVAFEQTRFVGDPGAAGKYEADAIFLVEIEDDQVSLVELGIEWRHLSLVEKCGRIPFDLFADGGICTKDDLSQFRYNVLKGMLQVNHVSVDLLRF